MKINSFCFFLTIVIVGFQLSVNAQRTFYRPPNNKILFIVGQDKGANGGFASPDNEGYIDYFENVPGGFTSYTSINKLDGLKTQTNYGSGNVCAQCYLDNEQYNNAVIAIGLYMVGQLGNVINGSLDSKINEFGNWIIATKRPVFLRIGYEFNASWAGYDPTGYIEAFRYLVNFLENMGVANFNTVWQSDGYGNSSQLYDWYPGDEYVDWLGYSHFSGTGDGIIQLARQKGKPVMIAEATPRIDLKTVDGNSAWKDWYEPFFLHMQQNQDVIQAFSYINTNWEAQSMWEGQGWGDSRVQINNTVADLWLAEISNEKYMHASTDLFGVLAGGKVNVKEQTQSNYNLKKVGSGYMFETYQSSNEVIKFEAYNLQGKKLDKGETYSNTYFDINKPKNEIIILKVKYHNSQQIFKL